MQLDFRKVKNPVRTKAESIQKNDVVVVVDADQDEIWDTYLSAFPDGTNPFFRERTEHDCSCCRNFIRNMGITARFNLDGTLDTIWDVEVDCPHYQVVVDVMAAYVKSKPVARIFLSDTKSIGTDTNREYTDKGTITHEHFFAKVDPKHVQRKSDIPRIVGKFRENMGVLRRSLEEITPESIDLVLELIAQGSLYRGAEKKNVVTRLKGLMVEYKTMKTEAQRTRFLYLTTKQYGAAVKFRNDVIGTLLVDISDGKDLTASAEAFGRKMDPMNYKRPEAPLITPAMKKNAEARIVELGLETALQRRYAVADDLTINNVLFADNSVKPVMSGGVLDILDTEIKRKVNTKQFDKVEVVPVDKFVQEILPTVSGVEVFLDNRFTNNMVSLIAPANPESNHLLRWGNNFSWSYGGDVTDSMVTQRVKAAGGQVNGDVRLSLAWWNTDDLDLHLHTPRGEIYFSNKRMEFGSLDVDANAGSTRTDPVENIICPDINHMPAGNYKVVVNQFSRRNTTDVGFKLEFEVLGELKTIEYDQMVRGRNTVIEFEITHNREFKVIKSWDSTDTAKDLWGLRTQDFVPVDMIMNSPNHWDGEKTGNKHLFFMLKDCKRPDDCRGLYNEFLRPELEGDRKVFEILGAKLRVQPSDNQLSGVGFSETLRKEVVLRLTGQSQRVIKVQF